MQRVLHGNTFFWVKKVGDTLVYSSSYVGLCESIRAYKTINITKG